MARYENGFWKEAAKHAHLDYVPDLNRYLSQITSFKKIARDYSLQNKPNLAEFYMQKAAKLESQVESMKNLREKGGHR